MYSETARLDRLRDYFQFSLSSCSTSEGAREFWVEYFGAEDPSHMVPELTDEEVLERL